jgi:hypothetical protein
MRLATDQGGVEDADQAEIGLYPQRVAIVLVEGVHGAGTDRLHTSSRLVGDLGLALHAVARLKVTPRDYAMLDNTFGASPQ